MAVTTGGFFARGSISQEQGSTLQEFTAVILAHNHPSGNLGASYADRKITNNVKEALKLVEIEFLDHLILNKDEQFATIED